MSAARRGRFITLEGGEGVGKSTQLKRLAASLERAGRKVVATREPGGAPRAEAVRRLVLEGEGGWSPRAETLLYAAARAEHWDKVIAPALAEGRDVLCDRFVDSTVAYQGVAQGAGVAFVRALHELVFDARATPDLTLILDLPVEEGLARARARGRGETRYERADLAFHQRVREAFLAMADAEPGRCVVIDARASPIDVANAIALEVGSRLPVARAREDGDGG